MSDFLNRIRGKLSEEEVKELEYQLSLSRNDSERWFGEICIKKHISITHSEEEEDMKEHWDWKANNSLVDVKGARKDARSDSSLNFDITWLEVTNVRGDPGWLKGKADFIAFEQRVTIKGKTFVAFLITEREPLKEWLKKKIGSNKKIVNKPEEALYRYYRRNKRKDIVSKVKIEDIKKDLKTWLFY